MDDPSVVVIGSHWQESHCELSFVIRSLAGAASRWSRVTVLSSRKGVRRADGAFDVEHLGNPGAYRWPSWVTSDCMVLVDELTTEIAALLASISPRRVLYLAGAGARNSDPSWQQLTLMPGSANSHPLVKFYVPVNPHASRHRHNGFGFTGYHLVLAGTRGDHEGPPPEVAWLTGGLHQSHVIVVEDGIAYAWKGRALRGAASVDSRMDLWRLVAHACVCIDLSPGTYVARECVEAMRFGTPVIVPADSGAASGHAVAGDGATAFADPAELLELASAFRDDEVRSAASALVRRHGDANHGSPTAFVDSLKGIVSRRQPLR